MERFFYFECLQIELEFRNVAFFLEGAQGEGEHRSHLKRMGVSVVPFRG